MKTLFILLNISYLSLGQLCHAQEYWGKISSPAIKGRIGTVSFNINGLGYVGLGQDSSDVEYNDFWEYNPNNNVWTKKATFPGKARGAAVGFSINDRGYVGTGSSSTGLLRDFWEYNPIIDSWSRKADFGGLSRSNAVSFVIQNEGYIGTGFLASGKGSSDFWKYNPGDNSWSKIPNLPGSTRFSASGFSIGSVGYIGTGYNDTLSYLNDFWEYSSSTNKWQKKMDFPGNRWGCISFVINGTGYLGLGYENPTGVSYDIWRYNLAGDSWSKVPRKPGDGGFSCAVFSLGNIAYIGLGQDSISGYPTTFSSFHPYNVGTYQFQHIEFKIFPNPSSGIVNISIKSQEFPQHTKVRILNHLGIALFEESLLIGSDLHNIDLSKLPRGVHFIQIDGFSKVLVLY